MRRYESLYEALTSSIKAKAKPGSIYLSTSKPIRNLDQIHAMSTGKPWYYTGNSRAWRDIPLNTYFRKSYYTTPFNIFPGDFEITQGTFVLHPWHYSYPEHVYEIHFPGNPPIVKNRISKVPSINLSSAIGYTEVESLRNFEDDTAPTKGMLSAATFAALQNFVQTPGGSIPQRYWKELETFKPKHPIRCYRGLYWWDEISPLDRNAPGDTGKMRTMKGYPFKIGKALTLSSRATIRRRLVSWDVPIREYTKPVCSN